MIILGGGMAGCLAGIINPQATIYEAQPEPPINHNAVLRFRDNSVSKVTGIPFKAVTVHKAICVDNKFVEPNIKICNEYSRKVTGRVQDRSIWNLDTVTRYVAPSNFQAQLFDLVSPRVILGEEIKSVQISDNAISTIPMSILCNILRIEPPAEMKYKEIHVVTAEIPDCDVYQTIYFPAIDDPLYRATITGNKLILEFNTVINTIYLDGYMAMVTELFETNYPDNISEQTSQRYGKIAPINECRRRQFLHLLTKEYNIYSAGRFAIWKNVLMDDVLQDLRVIKEMQAKDDYEHTRRQ